MEFNHNEKNEQLACGIDTSTFAGKQKILVEGISKLRRDQHPISQIAELLDKAFTVEERTYMLSKSIFITIAQDIRRKIESGQVNPNAIIPKEAIENVGVPQALQPLQPLPEPVDTKTKRAVLFTSKTKQGIN